LSGSEVEGDADEAEVDERPRKRSRVGSNHDAAPGARSGKKPGGKTAGKGTKPRTIVRGTRGLVPLEVDAEGNTHKGGHLPNNDLAGEGGEDVEDDAEEQTAVAARPELDDAERRRRTEIKEKEKVREEEVVRRMTKAVQEDGQSGEQAVAADVEIWEGVELV
jgi:histone acetyltransferase